ncbi:MAG: signal recognition particle-docking protein FtsY [Oscillospiraceae bacterium]|jgi:fused signal recognition particle receptor|nr:signal recognition particle-docking protein FtsY [Oscillospiraceae bacterium]
MKFFEKIKASLTKTTTNVATSLRGAFDAFTGANDEFFDDLEERLILSDAGADFASRVVAELREIVKAKGLRGAEEIKAELAKLIAAAFPQPGEATLAPTFDAETPVGARLASPGCASPTMQIILMVGVNGVGKTTTIGKLAANYVSEGKRVLLAAGDTFRAAAADQLEIWAKRANCEIVRGKEGGDPAAVIYDAIAAAKARGCDVVICDTAGRLHNKSNLMKELEKIDRVITREAPEAARQTLLVIDAVTGQNGLFQAKEFSKTATVTGVVLTKLDGTAKGGIVIAIAEQLKIPVVYVGTGEKQDDLIQFDAEDFANAIVQ